MIDSSKKDLHMHRLHFDAAKLLNYLKDRRLYNASNAIDLGYGIHSVLRELFGSLAPQPFHILGCFSSVCEILGYSSGDFNALNQHATLFSDPALHQLVLWTKCSSKKMPFHIPVGSRLGFEVRICPIKRSRDNNILSGKPKGILREYDAFLPFKDNGISRDEVYRQWLSRILEEQGGVKVHNTYMEKFTQNRHSLQRRDSHRTLLPLGVRPDATFSGIIEILDSNVFYNVLSRGIGRHKAFGFGMLLIKSTT